MSAERPGLLPGTTGVATARNLGRCLAAPWDVRVTGAHLVPGHGPVLLAANHTGVLDGPLLVAFAPRPVHLLAKSELFVPPWGALLRSAGQIPIEYATPDRWALRVCRELLADGRVIGVFPEGHRGRGDVQHIKHGVGYLAVVTGAPVVPVAVLGGRRSGSALDSLPPLRSRVDLVFGEPFRVAADLDHRRRAVLAQAGEHIRQVLVDHVAIACRRTGHRHPELPTRQEGS